MDNVNRIRLIGKKYIYKILKVRKVKDRSNEYRSELTKGGS